jgi:phosphoribosylaminoimidazolecarboxamide formyltransferase/IMP cyclohydrolase
MAKDSLTGQYRRDLTENFPDTLTIKLGDFELIYEKRLFKLPNSANVLTESGLRYGENPDQEAALYRLVNGNLALSGLEFVGSNAGLVSSLGLSEGAEMRGCRKHPSKTNLTDVDSALGALRYLSSKPAAVIVKHNNPSGAAWGGSVAEVFNKAYEADRVAAFGGALVVNRALDKICAEQINQQYLEVVAAPDYEPGAIEILERKPDLRIFKLKDIDNLASYAHVRFLDIKSLIDGGVILQHSAVNSILKPSDFKSATATKDGQSLVSVRSPTEKEFDDLLFGWALLQSVISNSVVFVRDGVSVGIGCGQQDRVGVVEIACFKAMRNALESQSFERFSLSYPALVEAVEAKKIAAEELERLHYQVKMDYGRIKGSVMVSDAFFPFRDAVDAALKRKITAIAHPGGSLRDYESLEAANQANPPAAMVYTNQRAFRH